MWGDMTTEKRCEQIERTESEAVSIALVGVAEYKWVSNSFNSEYIFQIQFPITLSY